MVKRLLVGVSVAGLTVPTVKAMPGIGRHIEISGM
jgi:hypothetical protein